MLRLKKGYVRIHICGGSYERFLNLCTNHGIYLWDLCPASKGYKANLCVKDFFKLKPLASKCHTRVRVCQKCGLPFFLNRHRKRKVFAAGLFFCGFFIYFLSCFVWNISLEGNLQISRQTMLEYLTQREISYGTPKRAVDCKQLAADLRNDFPNLIWVSVKLQGTKLAINVQENTDEAVKNMESAGEATDLIAADSGTIVKMITREGAPMVREGDCVAEGDLLVSGRLEITDDSGSIAAYRYCAADADIYIKTEMIYDDEFPMTYETPEYTGRKRCGIYLKLFGRCLGLDLGTQRFEAADFLNEEHQLHILRDFYLPVSMGIVSAREYKKTIKTYTKEEANALAEAKLQKFLRENTEKGVQIFENNVRINISATSCHAHGTLTIVKKTGRRVVTNKTDLQQEGTNE